MADSVNLKMAPSIRHETSWQLHEMILIYISDLWKGIPVICRAPFFVVSIL